MPYLNLDVDYFNHRKTLRLEAALGQGAAELPIRIWAYTAKFHPEDGRLLGYSEVEIEAIAKWGGEQGKMIETMIRPEISLLEKIEGGYVIHNWLEHAGHLSAFKKRAKTAAKRRWKKYASSNAKSKTSNATTGMVGKVGKESSLNEGGLGETSRPVIDLAFEAFWRVYPPRNGKKVRKKQAFEQWKKEAGLIIDLPTKIMAAIEKRKTEEAILLAHNPKAFVENWPDADRWLKHQRWDDEISDSREKNNAAGANAAGRSTQGPDKYRRFEKGSD